MSIRRFGALAALAILAGCSGGHTTIPPVSPQPNPPGRTQMNVLTSYTVYGGTASDGTTVLDVEPLNTPSALAFARAVSGATVILSLIHI